MTDELPEDGSDLDEALVSRIALIEERPLEDRAAAFASVHDELRAMLEGADSRSTDYRDGRSGS
jgi:hypothetical protein